MWIFSCIFIGIPRCFLKDIIHFALIMTPYLVGEHVTLWNIVSAYTQLDSPFLYHFRRTWSQFNYSHKMFLLLLVFRCYRKMASGMAMTMIFANLVSQTVTSLKSLRIVSE